MPPRRSEHHKPNYIPLTREGLTGNIVESSNLLPEEALAVIDALDDWIVRTEDGEPAESIAEDVLTTLAVFEERAPRLTHWDSIRLNVGKRFMERGDGDAAATLIADMNDMRVMSNQVVQIGLDVLRRDCPGEAAFNLSQAVQDKVVKNGRAYEFWREARSAYLCKVGIPQEAIDLAEVQLRELKGDDLDMATDWASWESKYYPKGPWMYAAQHINNDAVWGKESTISRYQTCFRTCSTIHNMLMKENILGKDIESLKNVLADLETNESTVAADCLRYAASLAFYEDDRPNMGKSIAKAIKEPYALGAVCVTLARAGKDREALDLVKEISEFAVVAKVLCESAWQDKSAIAAMIDDITVAAQKTARKYDPDYRIGMASGLLAYYQGELAKAEQQGSDTTDLVQKVAGMQKRVALLTKQKASGYIKPPAKQKGKK